MRIGQVLYERISNGSRTKRLYKGTFGDNPDNIPDELKGKIKLPPEESKLKHIFRDEAGHIPDTPENRELLVKLANDDDCHPGKDKWGNEWRARNNDDGTQDWVEHRNLEIWDGGKNSSHRDWDDETGLKYNPLR